MPHPSVPQAGGPVPHPSVPQAGGPVPHPSVPQAGGALTTLFAVGTYDAFSSECAHRCARTALLSVRLPIPIANDMQHHSGNRYSIDHCSSEGCPVQHRVRRTKSCGRWVCLRFFVCVAVLRTMNAAALTPARS